MSERERERERETEREREREKERKKERKKEDEKEVSDLYVIVTKDMPNVSNVTLCEMKFVLEIF